MRRILLALLTLASLHLPAHATSTVNPTAPAEASKLTSAVVRNNFIAAYNDINNILGKFAKSTAPTNQTALQDWVDTSTSPVYVFKMWNPTTNAWVSWASLNINTGIFSVIPSTGGFLASPPITINVSGGVVTYGIDLDANFTTTGGNLALANIGNGHLLANCAGGSPAEPGNCTWNNFADQAIGSVNGSLPYRTGGSWTTASTGVSGHALPFLDGVNTYSALQTIYPGSSSLPPAISGTLLEIANLDGTNSRLTMTSAGASAIITGRASLGTLASPLTLTSGTLIASFNATGYDGTSWTTSAGNGAFRVYAEGTWTNTSHPTEVCDSTTPSGSLSIADILCTHANGGVTIGALTSQGAGSLNLAALYGNNTLVVDSSQNVTGATLTSLGSVTLGVNGGSSGTIVSRGSTSGSVTVAPPAVAGSVSLTWPTVGGTVAASGTSPIVVSSTGAISCPTCNVTGANVSSVANSDSTLTISPTTGAVVASLNLNHANTWTAAQTFSAAITYGGVTLSNAVTGTGNMVLGTSPSIASPTFTGTVAGGGTHPLSVLSTGTLDTVIGYWGSTTASAIAINNCSNALIYSTSTHTFGCNASAGTGTVTSVATAGLATGGPITTTGTVTVTAATKSDQQTGTSTTTVVTPAQAQSHDSAAKAWLYCTNSAGTYTLTTSYNISGGTCGKTATGDLTFTFATAFVGNPVCVGSATTGGLLLSMGGVTTTTQRVIIRASTSGVATDVDFTVACYGRQ